MVSATPEEIVRRVRRQRELVDDYGTASTALIQKVGEAAEQAFYALPNYQGAGQRLEYVELYEQILFGARIEAATTAIAFHKEVARLNGKSFSYIKPKAEDFFPQNLRMNVGSPFISQEPYQTRPFREVYKQLNKGKSLSEAVQLGGARARILAQTDVQLARRRASLFARRANDNIVGYIRVLTGAESCGLCYVASTQRYRKGDLNPIHPGCDCGELPIYGDTDPGQVIDQYNLDRIRESFENKFGDRFGIGVDPSARDLDIGKFVQYKDGIRKADFTLVSVREHGELGPVLTRRKEKFTTLADIEARKLRREAALARIDESPLEIGLRSPARQIIDRLNRVSMADEKRAVKKISEILRESLGVETVDMSDTVGLEFDVNPEKFREAAKTLVQLQDKYPTRFTRVQLSKGGGEYASVIRSNPHMKLTDKILQTDRWGSTEFLDDLRNAIDSGHFGKWEERLLTEAGRLANEDIRAVVTHEYAHLLDQLDRYSMKPRTIATRLAVGGKTDDELFELAQKYMTSFQRSRYFDDAGKLSVFGADPNSNVLRSELKKELTELYIRDEISGYAGKNPRELIAEAFAQYEFLGDEATPLAREISETLLKRQVQAVQDIGLDVARQVTDSEVSDIASDALSRIGPSPDLDADLNGPIVQAIRAAGLVKKKTSITGAALDFVVQEAVITELQNRIRRQVEAEIASGATVAS